MGYFIGSIPCVSLLSVSSVLSSLRAFLRLMRPLPSTTKSEMCCVSSFSTVPSEALDHPAGVHEALGDAVLDPQALLLLVGHQLEQGSRAFSSPCLNSASAVMKRTVSSWSSRKGSSASTARSSSNSPGRSSAALAAGVALVARLVVLEHLLQRGPGRLVVADLVDDAQPPGEGRRGVRWTRTWGRICSPRRTKPVVDQRSSLPHR